MIEPQTEPVTKEYSHFSPGIARLRMFNQQISHPGLTAPHEVARAMGFVQAQDYLGSLWAIGVRMKNATEAKIESALADGSMVRTWPSRNTLGFVAAEDVRWILDLLSPRAMQGRQGRYRRLELDAEAFTTSARMIGDALGKKGSLTRAGIYQVLEASGVSTKGQRGIHILSHLALEKLICFGPREGKQQTFVLLDEWVRDGKSMPREEALGELTLRYYRSHGPATVKDFAWWSGLTVADVRAGLESVKSELAEERIGENVYWMSRLGFQIDGDGYGAVLLPGFDEFLVGYTDRSAVLAPELSRNVNANGGMLNPVIVIEGRVMGTWKRTLKKDTVEIMPSWFYAPGEGELELAAKRYGEFLGLASKVR